MEKVVRKLGLSQTQITETKSLGPKDRIKVLEKASKDEIGNRSFNILAKIFFCFSNIVRSNFYLKSFAQKVVDCYTVVISLHLI